VTAITVFGGSRVEPETEEYAAAVELGRALAHRGLTVVTGGYHGVMEAVSRGASETGGHVIGVIPESLMAKEVGHQGLTELRVVGSMHERKALMADLAEGFIALPGGYGTFEEFCEVVTWSQLGLHAKPCGVLNAEGYYDPLLALFDHAVKEGFLRSDNRTLVLEERDPRRLLEKMSQFRAPAVGKWITDQER